MKPTSFKLKGEPSTAAASKHARSNMREDSPVSIIPRTNIESNTEVQPHEKERFSVEDEETLTEFAIGDDGHIYLPGQPMPDTVKRMREKSLDREGSAAYDGENQKGAVDYEQGSIGSETEEIYLRNEREGRPGAHAEDRGRKGSVSETPGEGQRRDTQKGGGKEKLPKSEKEHIVETTKTEGSNWAKSTLCLLPIGSGRSWTFWKAKGQTWER